MCWENTAVDNGWSFKMTGHLSHRAEKGVKDHIASGVGCGDLGPDIWSHYDWLAGLCAQTKFPYERTDKTCQFFGHLVMPVFRYVGIQEILVGVIALVTYIPKESYIDEFNQINKLLKGEKLATAKKIKLDYMGDKIMFSLPLKSGTTYLWRNVTERFNTLNQGALQIMYYDYYGSLRTISTDADLQACLADPNSMGKLAIK
ncbi:PB1 domain-containing protein, partial [Tanacetum coccineum]